MEHETGAEAGCCPAGDQDRSTPRIDIGNPTIKPVDPIGSGCGRSDQLLNGRVGHPQFRELPIESLNRLGLLPEQPANHLELLDGILIVDPLD